MPRCGERGSSVATGLALALLAVAAGCAWPVAHDAGVCQGRPEVRLYLIEMRSRVLARWEPPAQPASEPVTLQFRLEADGSLAVAEVVAASSPALAESVLAAMQSAAPFGPMEAWTRCLAGRTLTAAFSLEEAP